MSVIPLNYVNYLMGFLSLSEITKGLSNPVCPFLSAKKYQKTATDAKKPKIGSNFAKILNALLRTAPLADSGLAEFLYAKFEPISSRLFMQGSKDKKDFLKAAKILMPDN